MSTTNWLPVLSADSLDAAQQKVYDRAVKKLEIDPENVPSFVLKMVNVPDLLKDTYMNVSRHILTGGALKLETKLIIAATVAGHAGNEEIASFFADKARALEVTDEQLYEAAGIAATSTSYNFYYKFRSLFEGQDFEGFNPGLRASLFMNPTQGKAFAELVNIVISTINGCKSCVNGHVHDALGLGITKEQMDEALRTGSIVMAMSTFCNA